MNREKKLAVYAGSFDPVTLGHLWMVERGTEIFDKLIVAIGVNPEKHCLFSVEERLKMLRESTKHLPNVKIDVYLNQFLIRYAQSVSAGFILRGIRSPSDYEYERTFANINRGIDPKIITILLQPPAELSDVSSSMVKGLVGPEGWEKIVKKYVSKPVFKKLKEKHREKKMG